MRRNLAWKSIVVVIGTVCGVVAESRGDDAQQKLIEAGREQFTRVRELTTMQASRTETVDRFFNARSCAECHRLGGVGGAGPNEHNVQLINSPSVRDELLRVAVEKETGTSPVREPTTPRISIFADFQTPGGRFVPIAADGILVLSRRGTSPDYAERRMTLLRWLAPNLPEVKAVTPARAERSGVMTCSVGRRSAELLEERNTPPLFGLGRIASIPQAEIDMIAASQPKEIRGRSPRLPTGGVGRFGWKSQTATLADFNEGACAVELGLKTAKFTPSQGFQFSRRTPESRRAKLSGLPDVDMTAGDLEALTAYVAALPEPTQVVDWTNEHGVRQGELAFHKTGCATCHVRDVGGVAGIYSDLLLHSVGTEGSIIYYGSPIGPPPQSFDIVNNTEIRTPPLWGVADSAPYLHDGSAATLQEAIARHSEQAKDSVKHYRELLSEAERGQLIAFLKSLRAPGTLASKN